MQAGAVCLRQVFANDKQNTDPLLRRPSVCSETDNRRPSRQSFVT